MLTAITMDNQKIDPTAGVITFCELCGKRVHVRAMDSVKVRPHYSHYNNADCDTWSEAESDWHQIWKLSVPTTQREVVITRNDISHRADIYLPAKRVVIENTQTRKHSV